MSAHVGEVWLTFSTPVDCRCRCGARAVQHRWDKEARIWLRTDPALVFTVEAQRCKGYVCAGGCGGNPCCCGATEHKLSAKRAKVVRGRMRDCTGYSRRLLRELLGITGDSTRGLVKLLRLEQVHAAEDAEEEGE